MIIREYEKKDIDELVKLWARIFGDEESFIQSFFELLPQIGTCVVGQEDGKIVAMTSILTGLTLTANSEARKIGYIYAVAVDSACRDRGFGVDISKAAYAKALNLGASIVTTMPSSDSLYGFYRKALGMVTGLHRKAYFVSAKEIEKVRPIPFHKYNVEREKLLQGMPHLLLSEHMTQLLEVLCKTYGGGLYETNSGICCAQMEEQVCVLYDMISKNPERTAASVAWTMGAKSAKFYLPSTEGEKFIMVNPDANLPTDMAYNVALE